jgi:hypothetical protein
VLRADLVSNAERYRLLDHEVELFGLSCKLWDEAQPLAYPHPQDALTAAAAEEVDARRAGAYKPIAELIDPRSLNA